MRLAHDSAQQGRLTAITVVGAIVARHFRGDEGLARVLRQLRVAVQRGDHLADEVRVSKPGS